MKLQPDQSDVQSISGYGPGWVGVDGEKITHSVILSSRGERIAWAAQRFEDLGAEHFAQLAAAGGRSRHLRQRLAHPLPAGRPGSSR